MRVKEAERLANKFPGYGGPDTVAFHHLCTADFPEEPSTWPKLSDADRSKWSSYAGAADVIFRYAKPEELSNEEVMAAVIVLAKYEFNKGYDALTVPEKARLEWLVRSIVRAMRLAHMWGLFDPASVVEMNNILRDSPRRPV